MTTNVKVPSKNEFQGIYEVPEAARYIRAYFAAWRSQSELARELTSRSLIRWVRSGISSPDLEKIHGRDLLVSFEDLVSLQIVAALRAAGISFQKIRKAEQWLREHTGQERPFATESLWTDRAHVFSNFRRQLIAADSHGQYAFDFIERYLIPVHGLTFGDRQIVTKWEPTRGIELDPLIQFGAPCVKGTRIPTHSITRLVEAGESEDQIAAWYELSREEIKHALEWERRTSDNDSTASAAA